MHLPARVCAEYSTFVSLSERGGIHGDKAVSTEVADFAIFFAVALFLQQYACCKV